MYPLKMLVITLYLLELAIVFLQKVAKASKVYRSDVRTNELTTDYYYIQARASWDLLRHPAGRGKQWSLIFDLWEYSRIGEMIFDLLTHLRFGRLDITIIITTRTRSPRNKLRHRGLILFQIIKKPLKMWMKRYPSWKYNSTQKSIPISSLLIFTSLDWAQSNMANNQKLWSRGQFQNAFQTAITSINQ